MMTRNVVLALGIAFTATWSGCASDDQDGEVRFCDEAVSAYAETCGTSGATLEFVRNSCENVMSDESYRCWVPCVKAANSCSAAQACCAH